MQSQQGASAKEVDLDIVPDSHTNKTPGAARTQGTAATTGATGKYEIIVQDKKGFFSSALPRRLPCCIAILCCFLNCVLPGIGTLICAPFSLFEKERENRLRNCGVNILAGFLQLILAIVLIGWFWSILWAIEFLKPLKGEGYEDS